MVIGDGVVGINAARIAIDMGAEKALQGDPYLRNGLNVHAMIAHEAVVDALGCQYVDALASLEQPVVQG